MSDDVATASDDVKYRVVMVIDVTYDFAASAAMVVLREAEGSRRTLLLPVGLSDATTIHLAWHKSPGRRPTTNELITSILQELQADLIAARIVRRESGIFYGELDLMTPRGRRVFDCRPSDALALALRQAVNAPLLVAEDLLED